MGFNALFSEAFANYPDRPAVLSPSGQVLTFAKLENTVARFAARLRREGVKPGDQIIPLVDNWAVRLCLWFALSRLGAAVIFAEKVAPAIAAGIRVDAIIGFQEQDCEGARHIVFHQDWTAEDIDNRPMVEPGKIFYTSSGTTGMPKFMSQSPMGFVSRLDHARQWCPFEGGCCLITIPENTAYARTFLFCALLAGQGVMGTAKNARETLIAAEKFGVNHIVTTPLILLDLAETVAAGAPGGKVTTITVGGAPAEASLLDTAKRQFQADVIIIAGASEISAFSGSRFDRDDYVYGLVGRPAHGARIEIWDENDRPVAAGETGRMAVWVPAEMRAHGYIGGREIFETSGWLATNDRARFDEKGRVVISGRLDEVINIGGTKLAPEIIQMIAAKSLGVGQVAARKVVGPDGRDALGLLVVPDHNFDAGQLRLNLAATLSSATEIMIRTVPNLPVKATGKLDRAAFDVQFST